MPNYDLKCPKCGREVEFRGRYDTAKKQKCSCGGKLVIRIKPVLFKIKGKTIVID